MFQMEMTVNQFTVVEDEGSGGGLYRTLTVIKWHRARFAVTTRIGGEWGFLWPTSSILVYTEWSNDLVRSGLEPS